MEVILKKEQRKEVDEILEFLNSLNTEEKNAFKRVIDGYKLCRQMEGKESAKN